MVEIGSTPFSLKCEYCGREYDTRKPHICHSFTGWLKKQSSRDDPVGDLSQAQQLDPCWPSNAPSLVDLHTHLDKHDGTIEGAHAALNRAWDEWHGLVVARNGT